MEAGSVSSTSPNSSPSPTDTVAELLSELDAKAQRVGAPTGLTGSAPVVILSSSSEEADVVCGYQGGSNSYVVKPVDFAPFAEAVGQFRLYLPLRHRVPQAGLVR